MKKLRELKISAFTLIEVLVSMLVLAIGLLGLAGVTVVVLRQNTLSQQISDATNIAASLMEDLKRQPYANIIDCSAGNGLAPGTSLTSCSLVSTSGLGDSSYNYFWPSNANNQIGTAGNYPCAVPNVLGSGVQKSFDLVYPNLVEAGNYADTDSICNHSGDNLQPRTYLRYYRTVITDPTNNPNARTLNVVVLWKDKFGKWRNVHFSTTRTQ